MPSDTQTNATPAPVKAMPLPKAPGAETLFVRDPTCRNGQPARVHDMLNDDGETISTYRFEFNVSLSVPYPHAMKFLQNDFLVARDEEMQQRVRKSRSPKEGHDGHQMMPLAEDEVIAALDELQKGALLKRAATLPGGGSFNAATPADVLMKHIFTYNKQTARQRAQVERADMADAGDGAEQVSLADLERDSERFRH